jgi:DNA-binding beta-propeller fold protein YncE
VKIRLVLVPALSLLLAACPPPGSRGDDDDANGIDLLGGGTHSLDSIQLDVIADSGDGLAAPRDLEFHPTRTDELWIVNQRTESVTVLLDAGTNAQDALNFDDPVNGPHFMARPSSLAFSLDDGTFATIHDTDELTQGPGGSPGHFMGPTRWTSDLDEFDAGHHGHLDMLHNSPLGMGIAWGGGDTWWVFDGEHSSLTRYNFNNDHGLGGTNHGDGETARFVEGEVDRREDVPSHMEFDHDTGLLYVADTGNIRVCVLDTNTGTPGGPVGPDNDGVDQYAMLDATLTTLIEGDEFNMSKPSGLALHDGKLWVSDARRGWIMAFDLDGNLLDYVDLELEEFSLNGIAFDEDGSLYAVDTLAEEILRITLPDE